MTKSKTDIIRELNDKFRKSLKIDDNNRVVITQGIQGEGDEYVFDVLDRVRSFDDFNRGNDPHQEHDFGEITYKGDKIFWKFDYYDRNLEYGSEDPSDVSKTIRVLTVMLATEY